LNDDLEHLTRIDRARCAFLALCRNLMVAHPALVGMVIKDGDATARAIRNMAEAV
jgi:hypothetical protein